MILMLDSTFRDQGDTFLKLHFKTQDSIDITQLAKLVPHDKRLHFEAGWETEPDGRKVLVFSKVETAVCEPGAVPSTSDERSALERLPDTELQTLAGERGVAWDPKASTATMIDRVLATITPVQPLAPAAEPPPASQPEPVVVTHAETPPKRRK